MKIIWTNAALEETKLIYRYFKSRASARVAKSVKNKIFTVVKNLQLHPRKGQLEELLSQKKGEYRYLVISNYKIIYKIADKEIFIMKVFDCRQNPVLMTK